MGFACPHNRNRAPEPPQAGSVPDEEEEKEREAARRDSEGQDQRKVLEEMARKQQESEPPCCSPNPRDWLPRASPSVVLLDHFEINKT